MERLTFRVRGSQGDLYEIAAERVGRDLRMFCTCQAGATGQHCKHRIGLLVGDLTDLASGNDADVQMLATWLPGSPLADALVMVTAAEAEVKAAQGRLAKAKKEIARAMYGRTATSP